MCGQRRQRASIGSGIVAAAGQRASLRAEWDCVWAGQREWLRGVGLLWTCIGICQSGAAPLSGEGELLSTQGRWRRSRSETPPHTTPHSVRQFPMSFDAWTRDNGPGKYEAGNLRYTDPRTGQLTTRCIGLELHDAIVVDAKEEALKVKEMLARFNESEDELFNKIATCTADGACEGVARELGLPYVGLRAAGGSWLRGTEWDRAELVATAGQRVGWVRGGLGSWREVGQSPPACCSALTRHIPHDASQPTHHAPRGPQQNTPRGPLKQSREEPTITPQVLVVLRPQKDGCPR